MIKKTKVIYIKIANLTQKIGNTVFKGKKLPEKEHFFA